MEGAEQKTNAVVAGNKSGCRARCCKLLLAVYLAGAIFYLLLHAVFLWLPAGKPNTLNRDIIEANVMGWEIFPALRVYPMGHIAGRLDAMEGSAEIPRLRKRVQSSIKRNYPVTFSEEEVNAWLAGRLKAEQGGFLARYVKVCGVWVDFNQDHVELIIEREFANGKKHVVSLFMKIESRSDGYSISRYSWQVGQVRMPSGFGRLLLPAFDNMVDELDDELKVWRDGKIRDIRVEEGQITFDPQRRGERL